MSSYTAALIGQIKNIGSAAQTVAATVKQLADEVSLYVANKISARTSAPNYSTKYQLHHIVAKAHPSAAPAQNVLMNVGIDRYNDPVNQVAIKSGAHAYLNSGAYFLLVNTIIQNAYYSTGVPSKQYSNVVDGLNYIRYFLLALSAGSPF